MKTTTHFDHFSGKFKILQNPENASAICEMNDATKTAQSINFTFDKCENVQIVYSVDLKKLRN